MTKKEDEPTSTPSAPSSGQEGQPTSSSGGMWVALIMVGLLVLIVGVEMLRSKS